MMIVTNKPFMMSVIMLNVIILNVIILNVIMLNVTAPRENDTEKATFLSRH